jgi:hypothetical protein
MMKGRTVILISRRVSTVPPAKLVEAGGYYASLAQKQTLEEELETL